MKAMRWILFSLLAFGLGTGVALAVHPPTVGIPSATASRLGDDLSAIQRYAAEGNCTRVRSRLNGAASKIDKLPERTSMATTDKLTAALESVRSEALSTCQRVNSERLAREQREAEAQATPTPLPEATVTPEPEVPITPDEGTTPDSGTGDETTPQDPSGGAGFGDDQGGDTTGGVPIPGADAVRQRLDKETQRLDKERRKWEDRAAKIKRALER
ncbi:MAG: hypothetical protein Q7T55_10815 [Solirubrobacteraceae bacterium]|nr:hypothetical protein [Solirubrobacteraceae bacterium]